MRKLYLPSVLLLAVALLLPGCGASKSADCASPTVFCVGLVTEVGGLADHSYNQATWDGVRQAKAAGLADWIASIESVDVRDYAQNIDTFASAGYDVIVTVGPDLGDATRAAATSYPNLYFIGMDQSEPTDQIPLPNLVGISFPQDQIGFLAGAAAALMTRTGRVGAVCVSQQWTPILSYARGFQAGVAYIDPKVSATVVFHDEVSLDKTFSDPEWGTATANTLIDQGADVIFGVGGTTGSQALVAAAERGAYAIGADTDQYDSLPVAAPRLLTSALMDIAPAVSSLIGSARTAQANQTLFPAGNYTGQAVLAPFHDLDASVPAAVKSRLARLSRDLLSGAVKTGVVGTSP